MGRSKPDNSAVDPSAARQTVKEAVAQARCVARKGGESRTSEGNSTQIEALLNEALTGYELLGRIHAGGQGYVYRARHEATRRMAAIKVLLDGPLATPHAQQRFAREIDFVSRLQHPNIVTLYDAGQLRGCRYYVMEYIDGLPVHDYALAEDLPVVDRVKLVASACRAVAHAHKMGIIHRDLKPSNILVDADGTLKVLDFGLSKDFVGEPAGTREPIVSVTGTIVGTWPYMSPEQLREEAHAPDTRSDVYSLGIVLYQLLTGAFPYSVAGAPLDVQLRIVNDAPRGLRAALSSTTIGGVPDAASLNADVEAIVFKALEKTVAQRYQSADELADDLDRLSRGEAVQARAQLRGYLLRKFLARHRRTAVLVGVGMVATLAATIMGVAHWHNQRLGEAVEVGLTMATLNNLGAVSRDDGRLDQAAEALRSAAELGELFARNNPVVQRKRYDALHMLSEMNSKRGRPDAADENAEAADSLAVRMLAAHPDDLEWQRIAGFRAILNGIRPYARGDWAEALVHFSESVERRSRIVERHPGNVGYQVELAFALSWQAKCMRLLTRYAEAHRQYAECLALLHPICDSNPDRADYWIDLASVLHDLAVLHIVEGGIAGYEQACAFLSQAQRILSDLEETPDAPRAKERATIAKSVDANAALAQKKLAEARRARDQH